MKNFKLQLLLLLICIGPLLGGCTAKEEISEAVSAVTEIPEFPSFIPEPDKTIEKVDLPGRYNYMEEECMPVLRNQGDTNTCWAFASLSALESSKDEDMSGSFSADHLIHQNPYGKTFEEGGAYVVTMSYLLSWAGPVLEDTDFPESETQENPAPYLHVQEIRQSEPKDYETIKKFVYLYGGVESAIYLDFDEYMIDSPYYNKEYNSYCYMGEEVSNHDIVIIGWDDSFPAENFANHVTSDGAFLCLNSWGENFGDRGTFYVSYEDVNVGGYGVVYTRIDQTDNYDKIYQSDLCGYTAQVGYGQEEAWFASAYTAEEAISLRAAGFYATGKNTEYEIYIVPDFAGKSSFKDRKYICNGFLADAGYYTIDFPEEVLIDAGNDFAILVKIFTENAEFPVAIECPVEGLSESTDMSDGRSYLSLQGTIWEYVEETKNYNICLKGYADLQ